MKTIGLIPGAMKPFHAGHNHLVQTAIIECDRVIIFTSLKDRGIIKGEKMFEAWQKVIIPLLPSKVEVISVRSPVRGVYDYFEWNRDADTSYRIYGGTEDVTRLSKARIHQYYPDINVVNVAEENPDAYERGSGYTETPAKGEWVRNSIQAGNLKEFKSYLPAFLKPLAKEYLQVLMS